MQAPNATSPGDQPADPMARSRGVLCSDAGVYDSPMAATCNTLAFDLGASSGRAILGRFDGERLTLEEVHRFENGPVRILDHLYWDAPRLLQEIKTGLATCGAQGIALDGVGIDTWGVDFGLLSAAGELLDLPGHYRDARTRGMFAEAFRRAAREEIYTRTGIQFMELNTLYQLLALRLGPSRLLDEAETLLFMPDLLSYWLTGQRRSERTIASTSQLLDARTGTWVRDLLDRLDIPARIMPPIADPATPIGPLHESVLDETGLQPTSVIAPAGHDTACAVAAVPCVATGARTGSDDWAYISSGTWSLVGVELDRPITTADALAADFTNEAGVAGTIRFLSNLTGLWLVQECRRTWAAQGRTCSFAELADMAATAPPRVSFIDPDWPRFASPGDMPRLIRDRCAATDQPVPQTDGQVIRCVLESLALKVDHVLRAAERLTGRTIRVVHIVGGGINNRLLCQLTADATGKQVIAGPAEATAMGNCLLQAMALGRVGSLDEIRQIVTRSTNLDRYEPRAPDDWAEARRRFAAVLTADETEQEPRGGHRPRTN